MTKRELEKEVEEKAETYSEAFIEKGVAKASYAKGYLAGAEPREKRIVELEAEVKEWKDKADLWCKTANLKDHNIMINKELEKENAELKKKNLDTQDAVTMQMYTNKANKEIADRQLTKAKEIIRYLCEMTRELSKPNSQFFNVEYSLQEAEQFLKDSEVEKNEEVQD